MCAMAPSRNPRSNNALSAAVLIAAAVGLFVGWKLFWFLTDDAYIAFRYVSNSLAGHGYVWNAPPFRPVEGYTSFLWVCILDTVWRVFKVPPPAAANWLSLFFTYLNLVLVAAIVHRLSWPGNLKPFKTLFLFLCFVFLLTNRSFLAWSSSGLETALFCVLVTAWVYACLYAKSKWRLALVSFSASMLTLTRPDGLLFIAASFVLFAVSYIKRDPRSARRILLSALPLAIVVLHLLWRRHTYGEWLPNTYFAKSVSMWPASGFRYAGSFVLEYGLWLWAVVLAAAAYVAFIKKGRSRGQQDSTGVLTGRRAVLALVVVTLIAHVGYYTIVIGGDHFEYRVYNHIIPFIFVSFLAALFALGRGIRTSVALAVLMILVSLPVQWTHWALTHNLNTRKQTYVMVVPIAQHWPGVFRWYAKLFDDAQSWLIPHHVCMRHQEHKIFHEFMIGAYPDREEGGRIAGDEYPVYLCTTVGVPGWVLPNVNILDKFGLNDYVIARMPVAESQFRMMAHDRRAPLDYIDGFSPNVELLNGKVTIVRREHALTPEKIVEHERFWWKSVKDRRVVPR